MADATRGLEELRKATQELGWPDDLLGRALEAGIPPQSIWGWIHWSPSPEHMEKRIVWHERLTFGPLRGREATLADNDGLIDLFAHSPESLGDWEVVTERGPDAFAQFRLQDRVTLSVIAEGNLLVASCGWARRKVWIGGQRVTVSYGQALRVRREYRGQGFGDHVRSISTGMANTLPLVGQYDLMRSQNQAVVGWWKKYIPDFFDNDPQREGSVPGLPVTVLQLAAREAQGDARGIRPARPEDLPRCVELVNRTHQGLDLFRPYSEEFLEDRLDSHYWGPRQEDWLPTVYGWDDFFVLEEGGRILACAGLWDRGRDLRERWRRKGGEGDQELVVSDTALMDFGHAEGAEDALLRLVDHHVGRTHALGRTHLLAPFDPWPALAEKTQAAFATTPETRALRWGNQTYPIERPDTDLAYW